MRLCVDLTYATFDLLAAAVQTHELRVRSLAAAALWHLAVAPSTIQRLPVADIVPALLDALLREHDEHAKQAPSSMALDGTDDEQHTDREESNAPLGSRADIASTRAAGGGGKGRAASPSVAALAATSSRAGRGQIDDAGGHGEDGPWGAARLLMPPAIAGSPEHAARTHSDLQASRAVVCTGYALLEQRLWKAGALLACLSNDFGRRAFHRAGAALRLLPLLEAPIVACPPAMKAATAALLCAPCQAVNTRPMR